MNEIPKVLLKRFEERPKNAKESLAYISKNAQENLFYEEDRWGNTINPRSVQLAAKELLIAISQGNQKVLSSYSVKKNRHIKETWNIELKIVSVFPLTQKESIIFLQVFIKWMDRKIKEYDKKKKEKYVREEIERQKQEEKHQMTKSQANALLGRMLFWSNGRNKNEYDFSSSPDYVVEEQIVRKFLKGLQYGNSVNEFEYKSYIRINEKGLWDLYLNGDELNVELELDDLTRENMSHVLEELLSRLQD